MDENRSRQPMKIRNFVKILLFCYFLSPVSSYSTEPAPEEIYPGLEYALTLPQTKTELQPALLDELVHFVRTTPAETSMILKERQGATGAFLSFTITGNLDQVVDYAYNPDIPSYITMPSSLRHQEWLTPQIDADLRKLQSLVRSAGAVQLLSGRDREVITPDANTGGYYLYNQDRAVLIQPGSTGPVLISVSRQNDPSDVGKKGCVVGDDKNWNYLYSEEEGLNTTGLGWVKSYMYSANSVIVYVADTTTKQIRVGSFKWLNAGWAKMNMVNPDHILNGIKRFASDFKTVLEAPGLPEAPVLADRYRELNRNNDQSLRQMVSPYLQALSQSNAPELKTDPFEDLLSSGKYLSLMSREEMIKVLMLEYVKECIGKEPLIHLVCQPQPAASQALLN